jgi:uncharacterized protein YkwD
LSLLVLVAALATVETAVAAPPCAPGAVDRATVLCELNAARAAAGRLPVQSRPSLNAAARGQARDMVARRYFAHESPEGSGPVERAERAGYLRHAAAWRLGEIQIWSRGAPLTAAMAVDAWLGSPGHRRVLLGRAYRDAGVGVVDGAPLGDPAVTPAATIVVTLGRRTF